MDGRPTTPWRDQLPEAVDFLRSKMTSAPDVALVLGSGLGPVAGLLAPSASIPYQDIPGFSKTSVQGHEGRLLLGRLHGKSLAVLQGRFHYYEGHPMERIVFPCRVLKRLGAKFLLLTASVGGIAPRLKPGDLALVRDHINFMGVNALRGDYFQEDGVRFPDMTEVYSQGLRRLARKAAKGLRLPLSEGIYCATPGPCYETPAEIRMFKKWGADMVGMSVVPEATVARQEGLEVLALCCVSNKAAGLSRRPLSHEEVVATAGRAGARMASLLSRIVELLPLS